jgi:hypothetical protein
VVVKPFGLFGHWLTTLFFLVLFALCGSVTDSLCILLVVF